MAKIPFEPIPIWTENPAAPELAIPGVVAYRGIETYHNIETLHEAYDQKLGIRRRTPTVNVNSLDNTSSAGTFIARPIHRSTVTQPATNTNPLNNTSSAGTFIAQPLYHSNVSQVQPNQPSQPMDEDEEAAVDDINLPYDDDDDDLFDVPLVDETGIRSRNRPTAVDDPENSVVSDDSEMNNGNLSNNTPARSRFPWRLVPLAIGGGTLVANTFAPTPPDPVIPHQPTPVVPTVPPPGPTGDPLIPVDSTGNTSNPVSPLDPTGNTSNPISPLDPTGNTSNPTIPLDPTGNTSNPVFPFDPTSNTSDPLIPFGPNPRPDNSTQPDNSTRPVSPIFDPPEIAPEAEPQVIMKESRIGTTLPTLPAFTTGLALGMIISSVATASLLSRPTKKQRK